MVLDGRQHGGDVESSRAQMAAEAPARKPDVRVDPIAEAPVPPVVVKAPLSLRARRR